MRFERFAGWSAFVVAVGGLLYALLFAWIVKGGPPDWVPRLWYALLIGGGVVGVVVLVALYERVRATDEGFALTALLLGFAGAVGGIVHGAYNLAITLRPPTELPGGLSTPADPVGVFRYGTAGLSLLVIGWLILRGRSLPRALGYLGAFGGVLLVVIFLGRMGDFITPASKVSLIPPFLYGFVVFPLFYVWLGRVLVRGR